MNQQASNRFLERNLSAGRSNVGARSVFISYSHDDAAHVLRVRKLADDLRDSDISVQLDQYVDSPPEGWPRWMERRLREADQVVVVCTREYLARLQGRDHSKGLGAKWEGLLITQAVYDSGTLNDKFIPVVFGRDDLEHIPSFLSGVTHYILSQPQGLHELRKRIRLSPAVSARSFGQSGGQIFERDGDFDIVSESRGALPAEMADRSFGLTDLLLKVRKELLADQIESSGGWSRSQGRVLPYYTRDPLNHIDAREGGIISTFLALRALAASSPPAILANPFVARAKEYLLSRQSDTGRFGRWFVSRSGQELRTNLRHTALASLSLMIVRGPPTAVLRGLTALISATPEELREDAAPSIAMSSVICALRCGTHGSWALEHLETFQRSELGEAHDRLGPLLRMSIESERSDPRSGFSPLWMPYSRDGRMGYESALSTIDFLTLWPNPPWPGVLEALSYLSEQVTSGGMPPDSVSREADVGMSAYFSAICMRATIWQKLQLPKFEKVRQCAVDCLQFVVESYGAEASSRWTYCNNLSNLLLVCPSAGRLDMDL